MRVGEAKARRLGNRQDHLSSGRREPSRDALRSAARVCRKVRGSASSGRVLFWPGGGVVRELPPHRSIDCFSHGLQVVAPLRGHAQSITAQTGAAAPLMCEICKTATAAAGERPRAAASRMPRRCR